MRNGKGRETPTFKGIFHSNTDPKYLNLAAILKEINRFSRATSITMDGAV